MVSIMFTCLQSQPLVVLGMLHPTAAAKAAAAALYSNQRTVAAFIAAHVHQRRRHSGGSASHIVWDLQNIFKKIMYGSF